MLVPSLFSQAQHHLSPLGNLHTKFDASIPPAVTIQPGEYVHVQTVDCYNGLVTPENPYPELERSQLNPVTGPIFIEGAMPGDLLGVTLVDIRPNRLGVACCGTHSGQLCHLVSRETTARFFDYQDGTVTMREDSSLSSSSSSSTKRVAPISFAASPMLGVVGVAPPQPISTMPAGKHGGNLDNKFNGVGATIYLPVFHPGALLSIGDMHASQGDGEISGTGVEIGGDVLLSCQVYKQKDVYPNVNDETNNDSPLATLVCQYPVTETAAHWITHGVVVENISQTTTVACEEAAYLLVGQWGFTFEEAFIFLSVKGDLGFCQSCHPDQGTQIAKMVVPKVDACPRPFRCLKARRLI